MITIIDYGLGNIKAFANVYKKANIPAQIAKKNDLLKDASKIILPGVGSFDHAMNLLNMSGMRETLDELVIEKKTPVLGICVGMQMLAHSSEEGRLPGLAWIDGKVKKLDITSIKYHTHLPHMGWNNISPTKKNGILKGLYATSRFYFLHSYYFHCFNKETEIATTEYGNVFSCAVNSENIFGVQFHPEKSHQNGVQLLLNFGNL